MRIHPLSEIEFVFRNFPYNENQGFYQSPMWAGLASMVGFEPELWVADDRSWANLVLKGHVPASLRRIPVIPSLFAMASQKMGICSWQDGPVCFRGNCEEALHEIVKQAQSKKLYLRNCTLPVGIPEMEVPGIDLEEAFTLIVPLNKTREEAYASITKKGRKSVRAAIEKGVEARRISSEAELKEYHAILEAWRRHLGFSRPDFGALKKQWDYLNGKDSMEVFMAYWKGEPMAAMGVVHYNGNAIEVMSAQSQTNYGENLFAGDLIKWKIIEWGVERGMRSYDLGGINPNPETQKEKNILQFKSKWGGELARKYKFSKNFAGMPIFGK